MIPASSVKDVPKFTPTMQATCRNEENWMISPCSTDK